MDRLRPPARWNIAREREPPLRAGRAGGGRVAHGGASSGVPGSQGMPQKRPSSGSQSERIPKETGERSFLGGMVSEPEFRRRRTTRAAWLIQRVHENHAARAKGNSDGGSISVGPSWTTPPALRATPACQVSATEEGEKTSQGDFQPRHLRGLELRRSTTD